MLDIQSLPCPVVVTNTTGRILCVNRELVRVAGRSADGWVGAQFDELMPLPARIFLQTHAWPMLYRDGSVREIHLQLLDAQGHRLPVMVNGERQTADDGSEVCLWVLFVAAQRSRFEAELLDARRRADAAAAALEARERFLRDITDAVPGLVAYWDKDLRCRFANSSHAAWYGLDQGSLIGAHMREVMGADLFERKRPHAEAALGGQRVSFEARVCGANGAVRHHLNHYIPDVDATGQVLGLFVLSVDVSQLKAAEAELRLAESVVRSTAEGIAVIDAELRFLSVKPAFTRITGYTEAEVLGATTQMLRSSHHDDAYYDALRTVVQRDGVWKGESWIRRKNGEVFLASRTLTLIPQDDDRPPRYVTVFYDVTERWLNDERMRHLALHDPLTDLPNRTLLNERLQQLVDQAAREPRRIAALFMDLDGFKAVNDRQGHGSGDRLLQLVAQRLLQLIRRSDTVARLGGDEFVVLLDNPRDLDEISAVAQRVVDAIAVPLQLDGETVSIGASVGIAVFPGDADSRDGLLQRADEALYSAKASGKGTYRFWSAPVA